MPCTMWSVVLSNCELTQLKSLSRIVVAQHAHEVLPITCRRQHWCSFHVLAHDQETLIASNREHPWLMVESDNAQR